MTDRLEHSVPKLDGSNYLTWKFKIGLILKSKDLMGIVDGSIPKPSSSPEVWLKSDASAQAIIGASVDDSQMQYVKEATSSKEMWDKLKTAHDDNSAFTKQLVLSNFHGYRMRDNQSLVDAYNEVTQMATHLKELNETLSEPMIVNKIVMSLPKKYKYLVTAWASIDSTHQTLANLLQRLRQEDRERELEQSKGTDDVSKARAYAAITPHTNGNEPRRFDGDKKKKIADLKKKTKCNFCHKVGHWKSDCFKFKKQEEGKKTSPIRAYAATYGDTADDLKDVWISDSGATHHITGRYDWFSEYAPYPQPLKIYLGNDDTIDAVGEGRVMIRALINDEWHESMLVNVLYAPGMRNLFSESQMTSEGWTQTKSANGAHWVDKNGFMGPCARTSGLLFIMQIKPYREPIRAMAAMSLELWHHRFGHINKASILKTMNTDATLGLDIASATSNFFCESCVIAKSKHQPAPMVEEKRQFDIGEMIHVDLSRKYETRSIGGSSYFLLCKDDRTNFRLIYFIKEKSQTPDCIIDMLRWFRTQTGHRAKVLKTDNGTEFVNSTVSNYLRRHGIVHETCAPYTSYQNGFIERDMQTIKNSATAMMQGQNLPLQYWGEAVAHAVYIHNRIVHGSEQKTPYEFVHHRRPRVSHLRVFGCDAYGLVPDLKRRPFGEKSTKMIFVGFDGDSNNYRLYDPINRVMRIHRNVKFNESIPRARLVMEDFTGPDESPDTDFGDNSILTAEQARTGYTVTCSDSDSDSCCFEGLSINDNNDDNNQQSEQVAESSTTVIAGSSDAPPVPTRMPVTRSQTVKQVLTQQKILKNPESSHVVKLTKAEGTFKANVPTTGKTIVTAPATSKEDIKLTVSNRPQRTIKAPDRYQPETKEKKRANMAIIDTPITFNDAICGEDADKWRKAMDSEMRAHYENNTWSLVERSSDMNVLSNKWVLKVKPIDNEYKARLVIRGFQQKQGVDYDETFSKVVRNESIRLLLAIAASQKLEFDFFDIKTAFLNAELRENIYMEQPKGFVDKGHEGLVCKLNKSLYGLKQASREWSLAFARGLEKLNLSPLNADSCVYTGNFNNSKVIIAYYVDDGLVVSHSHDINNAVIDEISKQFKLKKCNSNSFVGFEIKQLPDHSIMLTQKEYIRTLLERFNMKDAKTANVPLQPGQVNSIMSYEPVNDVPYQELVGALIYLSTKTRPDIAFAVNYLSRYMQNYSFGHWQLAKYVLRYLLSTVEHGIIYEGGSKLRLIGYSDSDYANDRDERKSVTGYVFLLARAAIVWKSVKQSLIALSSTESELYSLKPTSCEAVWLRNFLKELGYEQTEPTIIKCDNTSTIRLTNIDDNHGRTKHIDVAYKYTNQLVKDKVVKLQYVPTQKQKADFLTKPLTRQKFEENRKMVGMSSNETQERKRSLTKEQQKAKDCAIYEASKHKKVKQNSNVLLATVYSLMLLTTLIPPDSCQLHTTPPIVWRNAADTPAITGYIDVYMMLQMESPCYLLNNETLHPDAVNESLTQCQQFYDEMILGELQKFCPKLRQDTHVRPGRSIDRYKERPKRFVLIAAGAVLAVIVLTFGLAVASLVKSIKNSNNIEDLEQRNNKLNKMVRELERQLDIREEALRYLEKSVTKLASQSAAHEQDFLRMKEKLSSSMFIVSFLMSRLMQGQQILRNANRLWQQGKLSEEMFDFFNITLPCENCRISLSTPVSCMMTNDRQQVHLRINVKAPTFMY